MSLFKKNLYTYYFFLTGYRKKKKKKKVSKCPEKFLSTYLGMF